ncbi:MAG: acetyl-CoA synthase subunit gamma, partial [Candidatus Freyarchaeota archaeon]|nr:acetyl-CoA synthase subunit gamma [Candidatus Jordarchaeia archaeon]
AKTLLGMNIEDIVLDPGTYCYGKQLKQTFENFIKLRRVGIVEGQRDIAFPIMCIPMTAWLTEKNPLEGAYRETEIANIFTVKYADLHVLHSLEPYSIIPILYLRRNIYTDPRTPVQV